MIICYIMLFSICSACCSSRSAHRCASATSAKQGGGGLPTVSHLSPIRERGWRHPYAARRTLEPKCIEGS